MVMAIMLSKKGESVGDLGSPQRTRPTVLRASWTGPQSKFLNVSLFWGHRRVLLLLNVAHLRIPSLAESPTNLRFRTPSICGCCADTVSMSNLNT